MINNHEVIDPIVEKIKREVTSWDGVCVSPHRYGGLEFRVGRRELGSDICTAAASPTCRFRSRFVHSLSRTAKLTVITSCRGVDGSLVGLAATPTSTL